MYSIHKADKERHMKETLLESKDRSRARVRKEKEKLYSILSSDVTPFREEDYGGLCSVRVRGKWHGSVGTDGDQKGHSQETEPSSQVAK